MIQNNKFITEKINETDIKNPSDAFKNVISLKTKHAVSINMKKTAKKSPIVCVSNIWETLKNRKFSLQSFMILTACANSRIINFGGYIYVAGTSCFKRKWL